MSEEGGRVFFARSRRAPDRDSEIRLVSVGVDIGSSTSHLAFSRIVMRRAGQRARVVRREILHESDILLTPYASDETIDTDALGRFIGAQYARADIDPEMIDTGALILTGVAAGKHNARAIGTLFAGETGRFVAVAAGDALETTLAAQGSGAVATSARDGVRVMNVDIGGGTSKIAICEAGSVVDLTAIDVGARLILFAADGRVSRIEPAARELAASAGLVVGEVPPNGASAVVAKLMAQLLFEACGGAALSDAARSTLRLPALQGAFVPDQLSFSGGVAEYITGREPRRFGDLGPLLADAVLERFRGWGPAIRFADEGIRATVIGASQYSVQLSGNTIFVDPASVLPLHDLPVIAPQFDLGEAIDPDAVSAAVGAALRRMGVDGPVALSYRWRGDATHARIDAFCTGLVKGLATGLALVLVGESDVGGLIGMHLRRNKQFGNPLVSIDGIVVREFDYIDVGELLQISGGVPVVVKSLVFPSETSSPDKDRQASPPGPPEPPGRHRRQGQ